jgi:hypothetical protein
VSSLAITYLVAACAAVFSLTAFTAWVLIPAWSAYTRGWQRLAAVFLSLYVLASFVGLGVVVGGTVIYFWDRIT